MLSFMKTMSTKMKSQFISHEKSTTIDTNSIETTNVETYIPITLTPQDSIISSAPHYPVFTVVIGLIDVFMLLVVYIVQEGTVLTSDTWIKMGCKYVPCMKPLYSKAEQEMYNLGLKSQCESFPFPYQFFRFFTPIFLHGGITHLLSNLVCQALVGTLLEGKYGTKKLGISYILFGCSGNIMSALCNPKSISVGASGAVYGLLFFCIIDNILQVLTSDDSQEKICQYLITCLVIPYCIVSIFFDVDISGRTDHAAHIGGVIMGILVAIYLCKIPEFITIRIFNGKERIQLLALFAIISYFILTLVVFYLFIPVKLK